MSDLKVRLLLEAEAAAALRALEQTQAELREAGDAAREAGLAGAAGADRLGDAFDRAGDRARSGFQAVVAGGAAAERSNLAVAGSAASVGAQFNDIAIMWAAGQSPFMTAIQQGTQLNQILGGQGLAGAAATARAAFATMFNPFLIGVIAALTLGGTFVQWLMDTGEAAKTVEDRIIALRDATKSYADAARNADVPTETFRQRYGELADEVKRALDSQKELAAFDAAQKIAAVFGSDPLELGGFGAQLEELDRAEARLAELRGELAAAQQGPGADPTQAAEIAAQLRIQLGAVEQQRLAVLDLEGIYGRTADEARALIAAVDDLAAADGARAQAEAAERLRGVMVAVYGSQVAANAKTGGLVKLLNEAVRAGAEFQATSASTSEVLAATVGVASDMASALFDAADGAASVANADIAGGISAALGPAAALAARLWDAARGAAAAAQARANLEAMAIEFSPGGQAQIRYGSRAPGGTSEQNALETRNRPVVPSGGSAGGGGGGGRGGGGGGAPAGDTVASLRAEAAAALAALDVAVAAIGVKVEAGLESSAEAADGVAAAKDRAADELAELVARLQAMGPAGQAAAEQLRGSLDGLVPAANRLSDTLEDGFKGPFEDFVAGASSAKDAFADFAGFIQRKLAEIVANQVWDGLVGPLLGGFGGGFGGGGGLGGLFGGLLGGGDLFAGLFASGGAPLSSMANRVVGTPTLFSMGDGRTGLLGEQDDEAILPLRGQGALALLPGGGEARLPLARGAGGDLGIVLPPDLLAAMQPFARGGAPRFAVPGAPELRRDLGGAAAPAAPGGGFGPAAPAKISLVINNTGEPVQAEAEVRQQGDDITIELMMERVDAGLARNLQTNRGALAAALQRNFGLQRRGQ